MATTLTIVRTLEQQGQVIKYRVRKDGGILVTQVGSMRFRGAEGNKFVRSLANAPLSEARSKQLKTIKPKKKASPQSRKKTPVSPAIRKEIDRLQRLYKKQGVEKGKPTLKNIRYQIETYGETVAEESLKKSYYYAVGMAYDENIEALILRLGEVNKLLDDPLIDELIQLTKDERDNFREDFTEEKLSFLLQIIYDFERNYRNYEDGIDSDYSDEDQIIAEFYNDYKATLQARYARTKTGRRKKKQ